MSKILIIEDDTSINNIISEYLSDHSYTCTQAFSGTEARLLMTLDSFDLIILDLMLPGVTGDMLISEIRAKSAIPIIVLSALTSSQDKVQLLSQGADDYMGKPFDLEELLVRIQVQERHASGKAGEALQDIVYRNWRIDAEEHKLYVDKCPVELTVHEFRILELLTRRPKKVFTKQEIFQLVWEEDYFVEDKTINVHISNIRSKLRPTGTEEYIRTVWGIGFTLS